MGQRRLGKLTLALGSLHLLQPAQGFCRGLRRAHRLAGAAWGAAQAGWLGPLLTSVGSESLPGGERPKHELWEGARQTRLEGREEVTKLFRHQLAAASLPPYGQQDPGVSDGHMVEPVFKPRSAVWGTCAFWKI